MIAKPMREAHVIGLLALVQFVNVLDFMMVMPLGPDLSRTLGIPTAHVGRIASAYTLAAFISGLAGGGFLDRLDRRKALTFSLLGLAIGTVVGGFARTEAQLLATRLLAGAFGGPATACAIAVLSDLVPPERRGVAMGKVMGAFSVASVLGVPLGLELSERFGPASPFFVVGAMAAAVTALAWTVLPPMRGHLEGRPAGSLPLRDVVDGTAVRSLVNSALVFAGNFALIPNFAVYLQYNLGFPREKLPLVYMLGGAVSFGVMRLAGRLTDALSATTTIAVGTVVYAVVVAAIFHVPVLAAVPLLVFPAFMAANSLRFVGINSLGSRVPRAETRARFLSLQNAAQHAASTTGSVLASFWLTESSTGALVGMESLALLAIVFACVVPFTARTIERRVRAREDEERRVRVREDEERRAHATPAP